MTACGGIVIADEFAKRDCFQLPEPLHQRPAFLNGIINIRNRENITPRIWRLTDPRNRCDATCPAKLYTNMGVLGWLAYIHAPIASAQELDTFLLLPDTTQAYQPEHTQPPFLQEKTTPRPQIRMIDQRQHTLFDRKACVAFWHEMIPSSIIRIQHPPAARSPRPLFR
ncbi:hypothetical protein CKAH01_03131 [Colletotrichum kahawae]|uniref:Uncharacterized protein n=1 Tax=Colletotrichum kahawae TaxID=34407 RepID=A0AAD9YV04_COLKA|nr:hypothetical protein CKAH01_03131 [Colletotrichum kahawae]